MKSTLAQFIDSTGIGTVLLSIYMHINELFKTFDYNKTVLALTSFIALVYLIMKAYHQFLVTKKFKKDLRKEQNKNNG